MEWIIQCVAASHATKMPWCIMRRKVITQTRDKQEITNVVLRGRMTLMQIRENTVNVREIDTTWWAWKEDNIPVGD